MTLVRETSISFRLKCARNRVFALSVGGGGEKKRTSNTLNNIHSRLNISPIKYQTPIKKVYSFLKKKNKKGGKRDLLTRGQRELIPQHSTVLVVKGVKELPARFNELQVEDVRGREIAGGRVSRGGERRGRAGEGFPYLNSKYLASRAATSPFSGSQSDFRGSTGAAVDRHVVIYDEQRGATFLISSSHGGKPPRYRD